jgi:hypothetical protein
LLLHLNLYALLSEEWAISIMIVTGGETQLGSPERRYAETEATWTFTLEEVTSPHGGELEAYLFQPASSLPTLHRSGTSSFLWVEKKYRSASESAGRKCGGS